MRGPLIKLFVLALSAVVLGLGAYYLGGQFSSARMSKSADQLDWLRTEFHLNDSQLSRIRALHEGYLPQCRSYCQQIAAIKAELDRALQAKAPHDEIEAKLKQIANLRAQCQAAMLKHFDEVSQAMGEQEGSRYLAEMRRMTLGAHESIEQSMSSPAQGHEGHRH